jgi:hypothetical protein
VSQSLPGHWLPSIAHAVKSRIDFGGKFELSISQSPQMGSLLITTLNKQRKLMVFDNFSSAAFATTPLMYLNTYMHA